MGLVKTYCCLHLMLADLTKYLSCEIKQICGKYVFKVVYILGALFSCNQLVLVSID